MREFKNILHKSLTPFTPFTLPIEQRRYPPFIKTFFQKEGSFTYDSPNPRSSYFKHPIRIIGFSVLPVSSPIINKSPYVNIRGGKPGSIYFLAKSGLCQDPGFPYNKGRGDT